MKKNKKNELLQYHVFPDKVVKMQVNTINHSINHLFVKHKQPGQ